MGKFTLQENLSKSTLVELELFMIKLEKIVVYNLRDMVKWVEKC